MDGAALTVQYHRYDNNSDYDTNRIALPVGGYPGFTAYPYREYSEVFFGDQYKVLRGGAWATRARLATPTFRNWDFPQRRQIFSGLRIAKDL